MGKAFQRAKAEDKAAGTPGQHFAQEETAGGLKLRALGPRFSSPEEVLEHAKIDLELYEIAAVKVKTYESGMKVEETFGGKKVVTGALVVPMFSVHVSLTRKRGWQAVVAERLLADIRALAPVRKGLKRKTGGQYLAEFSLPDLHLANQHWTLEDAGAAFAAALDELIERVRAYKPELVCFPIGNDFLHSDNPKGTTTSGTQVEAGDWYEAFTYGSRLLTDTIDKKLRRLAPVVVPSIPGNHDEATSFCMAHVLEAYYHNDPDVEVLTGPDQWRFVEYGVNLIGYNHGRIKATELAGIMACEMPDAWARSKHREWHLGDQHRRKSFEEKGVAFEYIPSLTPTDHWHRRNGYVGHHRGAMAFVYDKDTGPVARFQALLR